MRFAPDSNILVYAVDTATPAKHAIARRIVELGYLANAFLVTQTIGEFLSVFARKYPAQLAQAKTTAKLWIELFALADYTGDDAIAAAEYAARYRLQYWDSLILVVAASRGAEYLLSEDMQDGLAIGGLTIVNPFNPANAALIDALLTPMDVVERP